MRTKLQKSACDAASSALVEDAADTVSWQIIAEGIRLRGRELLAEEKEKAASAHNITAVLIFSMLAEQGDPGAISKVREIVTDLGNESADTPITAPDRRPASLSDAFPDLDSDTIEQAIASLVNLPPDLRALLEFVSSDDVSDTSPRSPAQWMQRASLQSALGNTDVALQATQQAIQSSDPN